MAEDEVTEQPTEQPAAPEVQPPAPTEAPPPAPEAPAPELEAPAEPEAPAEVDPHVGRQAPNAVCNMVSNGKTVKEAWAIYDAQQKKKAEEEKKSSPEAVQAQLDKEAADRAPNPDAPPAPTTPPAE